MRGLSNVVVTILLIALSIAAVVAAWGVYQAIIGGAVGGASVSAEDSIITVNSSSGSGMVLIVLNNHGPAALSLLNITIVDDNGNNIVITPTSSTAATIRCTPTGSGCAGFPTSTGNLIVGGKGVGYANLTKALIVPSGQRVSFQFNFNTGLQGYFTPGTSYRMIIWQYNGPLVRLTVTVESE